MNNLFNKRSRSIYLWNGLILSLISVTGWAKTTVVPFDLTDNRIFAEISLNDQSPFYAIFDTCGGGLSINSSLTAQLGVIPEKWFQIGGAGSSKVWTYSAKLNSFEIGSLSLSKQDIMGEPLEGIQSAMGFSHFDGIFGEDLLDQFVIRVDFDSKELSFIDPPDFDYQGHGSQVPFDEVDGQPVIRASVEGIPVTLWVDTGDRSTLTLFESFVNKNQFLKNRASIVENITGYGIGGPIPAKVAAVKELNIGPIQFQNVPARFPAHAYFPYDHVDGTIGTGLLRAENLIFDKPTHRLILESSKIPVQNYDRSGTWILKKHRHFYIEQIVPQGPAFGAGLRVGDFIVGVNGMPASRFSLPELRDFLSDPKNEEVFFRIRRGHRVFNKVVHLKEQI